MNRFRLLLWSEIKLARTALPIHLVAIIEPTVLFLIMTLVLAKPTMSMNLTRPTSPDGEALLKAMAAVGSPAGVPYIDPVLVDTSEVGELRQVITVEAREGQATAVQRYGRIDSNQVKNLRDRLTAAALRVWEAALGGRAVALSEHPWLPRDLSYPVYFSLALLPVAGFMAAAAIGGVLMAQDFEFGTALEYRLSPVSPALILGARLLRLVLSSLLSAALLLLAAGRLNRYWPAGTLCLLLVLLPVALMGSAAGMLAGLLLQRTIPAFVVALVLTIGGWIFGSGFALASNFGGLYQRISRLTPNAHAVDLLFPLYFGAEIGAPTLSALVLALSCLAALGLLALVYWCRVVRSG